MKNFKLMATVNAMYSPLPGQSSRSSHNFEPWDVPKGSMLWWEVIPPKNKNYPPPVFDVIHDRTGPDSTWYINVKDGDIFSVGNQYGEPGGHSIYVATRESVTKVVEQLDLNPNETYTVKVHVST